MQSKSQIWNRRFWLALIGVLALAAVLRLYRLGEIPQYFDQDEIVLGYDAWSLWQTGADHHGAVLPLHFRAFNDYIPGAAQYIVAPFVGLLGLDEFSTRLPFALMGIATIGLTALIGRRWFGPTAGLIAALLLALDPMHVNYSRIAFVNDIVPFFIALSLYAFNRFVTILDEGLPRSRGMIGWMVLCASAFAVLTMSYSPMKLQAPILFGICALAAAPILWRHRRAALGWIALYAVFVSPLVVDQVLHWSLFQVHFDAISVWAQPGWPAIILGNYAAHYNPMAWFIDGLKGGVAVHSAGIGELFWLEGPLWIAAVIGLAQRCYRRTGFSLPILLGLWFAAFPLASSLTTLDIPSEVRTIGFLPLPELLAGFGAAFVILRLFESRWRWRAVMAVIVPGAAVLITFSAIFLNTFFSYPWQPHFDTFNVGLRPVLDHISQEATPCDEIWLEYFNQSYIYYLFYTRYPPAQTQRTPIDNGHEPNGWAKVRWFGNVRFGTPPDEYGAPKESRQDCTGKPSRLFFASRTQGSPGPDWREVFSDKSVRGDTLWREFVLERQF